MKKIIEKLQLNGKDLVIETGEMAKQAHGAVKVTYGETVILATCCYAESRGSFGFFPLTVDYRERTYAAGKIPGGFFKREGRPSEKEIITSRLIDRPIRPLFPEGYNDEIQIMITVLSSDGENDPDIPAMIGASCALSLSGTPFCGPIGSVRIGMINGNYIINPTYEQIETSSMNLIVSGTRSGITMLEGESIEVSEDDILNGIEAAESEIKKIIEFQSKIVTNYGTKQIEFKTPEINEALKTEILGLAEERILKVFRNALSKKERSANLKEIKKDILEKLYVPETDDEEKESEINSLFEKISKQLTRKLLKEENLRVDGRKPDELRPITCDISILPRTHGSGMFTKGETQALCVVTLGSKSDEQIMDALAGKYKKSFMLHYNFPSYSVGEVRPNRGPGRREIGHGLLAEKSLIPILPEKDDFPYTIRLVSDILESNGSSSMATVCSGTLALLDAGVPIKNPVAGIGMGIMDDVILTDIMGDEDHAGDMDFKVSGTKDGITSIQMDIKVESIDKKILIKALAQAKAARLQTLEKISEIIPKPREDISEHAPRISIITIDTKKIGLLIGPGGSNIKSIQEDTDSDINIDDNGTVTISAGSKENLDKAIDRIKGLTEDAEIGKIYNGTVKNILDFGAFVEILPGKEGLVHISEIAPHHVKKVTDVLHVGEKVKVKCIEIDDRGRINLSRKKALDETEKNKEENTDAE